MLQFSGTVSFGVSPAPTLLKVLTCRSFYTESSFPIHPSDHQQISVPGHIKFGYDLAHPAIATTSNSPQHKLGKRGAQTVWNYANASFLVAALLNYQWSLTGGPRTREEKAMLWTLLVAGYASGYRYAQVGAYSVLSLYWLAPTLSAAAMQLS
jgi:hypothetical protein